MKMAVYADFAEQWNHSWAGVLTISPERSSNFIFKFMVHWNIFGSHPLSKIVKKSVKIIPFYINIGQFAAFLQLSRHFKTFNLVNLNSCEQPVFSFKAFKYFYKLLLSLTPKSRFHFPFKSVISMSSPGAKIVGPGGPLIAPTKLLFDVFSRESC